MKKVNNIKKNPKAPETKTNPSTKIITNRKTDPMLNSLFKGQKFIDFQEPIQSICHIKETHVSEDIPSTLDYCTESFLGDNNEIKENQVEASIPSNDNKLKILNEYLKRGNYSGDTGNLQTNYTSPQKKVLTTEMIQSEEFLDFINETENNNLEFLKTLYRLKSADREVTHRKRESYSFVNTIKDEARYNLESRYKENNDSVINSARKVDVFKSYKKEAYVTQRSSNPNKIEKNSVIKLEKFNTRNSNISSKSIISNKLTKSTNINKNNSALNIRDTSYVNTTSKKNSVKLKNKPNLMSLKDLQVDLSKLSSNVCYKNDEIVNYGTKPLDNQNSTKEIPIVEIDLFGDDPEPDVSKNTLQLFPVYESGDFQFKQDDTYGTPNIQLDLSLFKNTFSSNLKTELASIDNSVLNQYTSERNKKQNQTTHIPTLYGTNNTDKDTTLNLSKFTNFLGMSQQFVKK
jgi:hypothetical protein